MAVIRPVARDRTRRGWPECDGEEELLCFLQIVGRTTRLRQLAAGTLT